MEQYIDIDGKHLSHDAVRAKVAALEAENGRWSEKYAAIHASFAQQQTKLEAAEAELAEFTSRHSGGGCGCDATPE